MEALRYPVGTIEQMAMIPGEALPRFMAELPIMLANIKAISELNAVLAPIGANVEVHTPVWIDDDLHTGTVSIRTTDGETVMQQQFDSRTGRPVEADKV